jgi:hypothetical protein
MQARSPAARGKQSESSLRYAEQLGTSQDHKPSL